MNSMYELLMGLPLFQGVSHARISELIEKIKFHFLKYLENEQLIEKGDSCKQLKFLISGSVKLELTNNNKRIRIFETLSAPNVLGAEYLFGRSTVYPYNVSASPSAGIMQIEKADYLKILKTDTVFLFNMLNYLSRNSQTPMEAVISLTSGSIAERFAFWIISLTHKDATDIVINCKQKDMYTMLGVQRSSFINTLTELQSDGIIDFTSTEIFIKDRERLADILSFEN